MNVSIFCKAQILSSLVIILGKYRFNTIYLSVNM